MKQNTTACFSIAWAVWAYVAGAASVSPRRSNATTPITKANATATRVDATIPVAAHQNHKIKLRTNHSDPPDPLKVETRVGCRTPLCIGPVDTLVLADVSGAVGENGMAKMQSMLQKFPHHFDLGSDDPRGGQFLALMQYDEYPKIMTQWTDDAKMFKSAATSMELGWSAGDLGAALAQANQLMLYARDHTFHNVVVITDGGTPYKSKALQMAQRLGQSGSVLFIVVIEDYVGPAHDENFEIIQATGQMPANDFLISVDRYEDLDSDDTIGEIVYMLCPAIANLLSVGSKVERRIVDGNRTAMTQTKKFQRNFRKIQTRAGTH